MKLVDAHFLFWILQAMDAEAALAYFDELEAAGEGFSDLEVDALSSGEDSNESVEFSEEEGMSGDEGSDSRSFCSDEDDDDGDAMDVDSASANEHDIDARAGQGVR